ncbi:hypothetical protein A3A74_02985 [Candidatus Roizmanbacteria bacterium RIFCSPLOWO2_01_FULL_35_13]|uniref:Uncharacterized protein n=1 Tax=Candidatus Roizmanbacteria bacterium RIFCSPLOWO2_01_FULL_35_13 TaxID=1802055 RepID=A0A1F7IB03_9BACT|nr:MAG: hypothetical protein A3A74_02985 [Candidatus Roizmanbacteria bacterium RIFCSPLOWO2_01_FULL_35_13]
MIKQQLEDTFEKLVEQGAAQTKQAVKSAVQQVASSVSATKMWEQLLGASTPHESNKPNESNQTNKSHTPLNIDKLAKSYQNNDMQKTENLKQRLFQLVKRGEEEVLYEKKRKEQEKKQKEAQDIETKKRKEQEARQQQAGDIPQGKVKRSIFSHKKVAQRQHAELKPSSGKQ